MAVLVGPSGGSGGDAFSDNPPAGQQIIQIEVNHAAYVDRITTTWADNSVAQHGGDNPTEADILVLENGEFINAISGTVGGGNDGFYVTSIQFNTNLRTTNVWGTPTEYGFLYDVPNGMALVGFFGRSGGYIDALGMIFENLPAAPQVPAPPQGLQGTIEQS